MEKKVGEMKVEVEWKDESGKECFRIFAKKERNVVVKKSNAKRKV